MRLSTLSCLLSTADSLSPRPRVVVSGGTHGNEYTGVWVLQRLQLRSAELAEQHPSIAIETLFANPPAHAANRRFIDDDLNRQFSAATLADTTASSFEAGRAKAIAADMGPKGAAADAAVCIDMHTTTANMGCTVIVSSYSTLALRAAAFVHTHWDDADEASPPLPLRVMVEKCSQCEAAHLASVARHGIEIEVGPTPQSLLRADVVASTERCLRLLLRYLELHYSGVEPATPATLPVYVSLGKVPFVDGADADGALPGAVVAASLQDRDFAPLRAGEALFEALDGSLVPYDGSLGEVVHPVFINEAAYYYRESGRGVGMSRPVEWPVL